MSKPQLTSDITFTKVVEIYLDELRLGVRPSIDSYVEVFPHLAKEIQGYFPTLAALEAVPVKVDLQHGDKLDNFIIESEIGRGGMGVVYRAACVSGYAAKFRIEQEVAIKVLPLRLSDARLAQRFEQERIAMMRLSHPNILPVYSHGYTNNYAYLVLKLIRGSNLANLLQNSVAPDNVHPLIKTLTSDWSEFARIAAELASGLQHAHGKGLIHRDIKPGNLLVDKSGKLWISDFGLAKFWDDTQGVSRTGDVIGTPRYMAPEQNQGICDARSDIYSLGVTLYELACGKRACFGDSLGSITKNRESLAVRDVRSINSDIPPELAKIIMRACEYLPAKRYQSAKELKYVLDRYRCGHAKADRRKHGRVSDDQFKRRNRRLVGAAIVVAVTCAGLAVAYSRHQVLQGSYSQVQQIETAPTQSPRNLIAAALSPKREYETKDQFDSPSQKIIDKLGARNQEDVVEVVSGVLSQAIQDHSVKHWYYTENAKNQLLGQVNDITNRFRKNELTPEDMDRFVAAYRTSSVAIASRLLQIVPQMEKSLEHEELRWGLGVTSRYSAAIMNQAVSPQEAMQFIDGIVRGRFNSIEESQVVTIPKEELMTWLHFVQQRLTTLPANSMQRHSEIPRELQELFKQHFGVSSQAGPVSQ